jgi:hypothetical protein
MLACSKFANLRNDKNNHWVNKEHKEIFKLARSNMTIVQQCEMIYDLKELGYVSSSNKVDNLNLKVNYINNDSEVVIELTDFRELGYEYMLYLGGIYIRCKKCGRLIKPNGRKKYCRECAQYQSIEFKTIQCVDCGCDVVIDARNMTKTRCDKCYSIHRRKQINENVKKYRNKNN